MAGHRVLSQVLMSMSSWAMRASFVAALDLGRRGPDSSLSWLRLIDRTWPVGAAHATDLVRRRRTEVLVLRRGAAVALARLARGLVLLPPLLRRPSVRAARLWRPPVRLATRLRVRVPALLEARDMRLPPRLAMVDPLRLDRVEPTRLPELERPRPPTDERRVVERACIEEALERRLLPPMVEPAELLRALRRSWAGSRATPCMPGREPPAPPLLLNSEAFEPRRELLGDELPVPYPESLSAMLCVCVGGLPVDYLTGVLVSWCWYVLVELGRLVVVFDY